MFIGIETGRKMECVFGKVIPLLSLTLRKQKFQGRNPNDSRLRSRRNASKHDRFLLRGNGGDCRPKKSLQAMLAIDDSCRCRVLTNRRRKKLRESLSSFVQPSVESFSAHITSKIIVYIGFSSNAMQSNATSNCWSFRRGFLIRLRSDCLGSRRKVCLNVCLRA